MQTPDGPNTFGMLLRRHRAAAGLSQEDLAERAGLSRRGISDLERGERTSPHPITVRRLADGLGLVGNARAALFVSAHRVFAVAAADKCSVPPLTVLPTEFIGRESELATLRPMLGVSRLLTLTGAGGVGKTRLALQLAAEASRDDSRGAICVDLAALSEPRQVTLGIAAALGIVEQPGRPIIDVLAHALQQRRVLLVLDGCDQVASACMELIERLMWNCPRVNVLATSRVALGSRAETSWRVPPLSLPPALGTANMWGRVADGERDAALKDIVCSDAVRLFVSRATTNKPDFTLTPIHASLIAPLCRGLGGIPLAVEIAAARVNVMPVERLAEQLQNAIRPLMGGKQQPLPPEQLLLVTLDWSYKLLSDAERRLLADLSVFDGSWTLSDARAVCDVEAMHPDLIMTCLEALCTAALLTRATDLAGTFRYRLQYSVRQYASQRFNSTSRADTVRKRHLDWSEDAG